MMMAMQRHTTITTLLHAQLIICYDKNHYYTKKVMTLSSVQFSHRIFFITQCIATLSQKCVSACVTCTQQCKEYELKVPVCILYAISEPVLLRVWILFIYTSQSVMTIHNIPILGLSQSNQVGFV